MNLDNTRARIRCRTALAAIASFALLLIIATPDAMGSSSPTVSTASGPLSASQLPTSIDPPNVQGNTPTGYTIKWKQGESPTITPFSGPAPALSASPADDGISKCNFSADAPEKADGLIFEFADGSCTDDVYYITGEDALYRGLDSPVLIGDDFESNDGSDIEWEPVGDCSSSTWAYWAEVPSIEACSDINGCVVGGPLVSDYHYYSC